MLKDCNLSFDKIDHMSRAPIHNVLRELGEAAVEYNVHRTENFQKLIAFLLEIADGRDRREDWTQQSGIARPIPKLRVAVEQAFGQYGDLQWFKLNKTANSSGLPLYGLYPRCAASVASVTPSDFGTVIAAFVSPTPDATLLRFLHKRGGKIKGMGMELFSRLAYVFRRELYFIFPHPWAETSGCLKYIGNDLRKYCAVCRSLRVIMDQLGVTPAIRGSVLLESLSNDDAEEELTAAMVAAQAERLATAVEDGKINQEQADKVSDKFARTEGAAFATGSGVGRPMGFMSYATSTDNDNDRDWQLLQHSTSGQASAITADRLFKVMDSLRTPYRQGP
ncbi:MAG: phage major capsid protein, partial [Planctomycetes bacterium]|nr:phage major capsid protein [Planctomycetota bacterium]